MSKVREGLRVFKCPICDDWHDASALDTTLSWEFPTPSLIHYDQISSYSLKEPKLVELYCYVCPSYEKVGTLYSPMPLSVRDGYGCPECHRVYLFKDAAQNCCR